MFLHMIQALLSRSPVPIESVDFVIGDLRSYQWARTQQVDPRIRFHYQHEHLDPLRKPSPLDRKRLADFETRYGIPHLRAYVQMQRLIDRLSDERKLAYVQTYLEYYESLWERTKPDAFLSGGQDCLPIVAANTVFRRNGCLSLVLMPGRVAGRFSIVDNHLELIPGLRQTFESLRGRPLELQCAKEVRAIREGYVKQRTRMAAFGLSHRVRPLPSPARLVHALRQRYGEDDRFFDPSVQDDIRRAVLMRLRWPFHWLDQKKFCRTDLPSGAFFFFALHLEPESSIDVQGTVYQDQLELVRLVAKALPANALLCVKDHPNMIMGLRPLGFLRQIAKIPNVRLLPKRMDSHEIIPRSCGVVTVTSTAGWEALMYGKPVLMFGRAFYEDFVEGVHRGGIFEQTALALKRMIEGPGFDMADVETFLAALLERTYRGINELWAEGADGPANHAALAEGVLKEIEFRLTGMAA